MLSPPCGGLLLLGFPHPPGCLFINWISLPVSQRASFAGWPVSRSSYFTKQNRQLPGGFSLLSRSSQAASPLTGAISYRELRASQAERVPALRIQTHLYRHTSSHAKTGAVLLTTKAGNGGKRLNIPGFSGPYSWADTGTFPQPPADLRDAVSGDRNNFCSGRNRKLAKFNSLLVEAKAGYWAEKMKEAGFASRKLGKNPGIEIRDP